MQPRRPRRILFVAHAYPPDSHAGVELYTARLAGALAARGWDPAVVTARVRPGQAQNSVEVAEVGGVRVHGIVQNWPYRDLPEAVTDPAIDRVFGRILDEEEPALVSVQTLAGLSAGMLGVAAARGIPVALHLHDGWWACPSGGQRRRVDGGLCLPVDKALCGGCFDGFRHREGPLERAGRWVAGKLPGVVPPDAVHRAFGALPEGVQGAFKRVNERGARMVGAVQGWRSGPEGGTHAPSREHKSDPGPVDPRIAARGRVIDDALRHVTATLSPTAFLAESLAADGLTFPDVAVVPTGVPAEAGPDRRDGPTEGPTRALFVGTWVPHKGPQVFAAALARTRTGAVGRAVGPAPFPAFRADVVAASGGRLTAEGPLPPADVAAAMDGADVVVVPSVWAENAPLVVLEARGRGRPVIASRLGGLPELVEDGVDGRLFEAGDAGALAALLDDADGLRALRATVQPPRSLDEFADDVAARYEELVR